MDFQLDASTNFIRPEASANWGDWLSVNEETSKGYVAAAFYGYDAKLMIEIAKALGKEEDVIKYTKLYENIKMAFAKKYLLDNGFTTEDTQTTYALALYFDLYPSKKLAKNGAKRLVQKIKENGYLFSTGFLGTKHIMPSLSKYGYHDTAYKLFQQTKYPSWGYSIENGSTSIWERWNSYTKDQEQNSTINAAMNSFSHYAFGSVAEWMFQYALGIDSEDSGYRNILIKPAVSKEMGSMKGSYDCINGKISSGWKWKGSKLTLDVSIPANTKAKVYIPTSKPLAIKEGKLRLNKVDGIKVLESGEEEVVVEIGSGDYTFTTTIK
jgi:alpha-L-rhamnosidase